MLPRPGRWHENACPRLHKGCSKACANEGLRPNNRVSGAGPGLRSQDVLEFWFGADPLAEIPGRLLLWFGKKDEPPALRDQRDADVAQRFGPLVEAAASGSLDHWASSPHRRLALILLLDQFPRQVYRGQAQAFAQDAKALALTLDGLQVGADAALAPLERVFFYLPLEHAESPAIQEESVAAFRRVLAEVPAAQYQLFEGMLQYALQHQAVIQHFGRFPQRNAALGRPSSKAELEYLRSVE
jgi:uncharacterized protein (DUF924 family)